MGVLFPFSRSGYFFLFFCHHLPSSSSPSLMFLPPTSPLFSFVLASGLSSISPVGVSPVGVVAGASRLMVTGGEFCGWRCRYLDGEGFGWAVMERLVFDSMQLRLTQLWATGDSVLWVLTGCWFVSVIFFVLVCLWWCSSPCGLSSPLWGCIVDVCGCGVGRLRVAIVIGLVWGPESCLEV